MHCASPRCSAMTCRTAVVVAGGQLPPVCAGGGGGLAFRRRASTMCRRGLNGRRPARTVTSPEDRLALAANPRRDNLFNPFFIYPSVASLLQKSLFQVRLTAAESSLRESALGFISLDWPPMFLLAQRRLADCSENRTNPRMSLTGIQVGA